MSKFPDFTTIDFAEVASTPAPEGEAWNTPEGVTVAPAYDADDVAGLDFTSGYPGVAPFVRGPYPTMYVTNPWTVRQYAGFSTAEDSNAFYRRKIESDSCKTELLITARLLVNQIAICADIKKIKFSL